MKKYFITLLLCFYFIAGYSQSTFYVSVVKGKVVKAGAVVAIKAGDKLTSNDKVSFSAKTDQLILLDPGKGRLVLSPQYSTSQKGSSLTGLIKDFLEMTAQHQRLSANTGKPVDSIQNIKKLPALRADSMKQAMQLNK